MNIEKILLINPPYSYEKQLGFLSHNSPKVPPMGLLSLGSFMSQKGFSVKIIDAQTLNLDEGDILRNIESYRPQLIGYTSVTLNISDASRLAKKVRDIHKGIINVAGGVHISALPEQTLRKYPYFDYAVIGEGEITFYELVNALNLARGIEKVKGLGFINKEGKYIFTGTREFISNLDDLPAEDWELIDGLNKIYHPALPLIKKLPSATLITGRGCIGRCIFCSTNFLEGKKLRIFSADRVVQNIDKLYNKYGIRDISFYDVNFMVNRQRFFDITQSIRKNYPKLTWSGYARIDCVDRDMLKQAKETGCYHISYGIESGNDEMLKFIKKGITKARARDVINMTRKAGITTRGLFMFGHPTETLDTLQDTLDFILELDLDDFHSTLFTPLPGTDIYSSASQYGDFDEDWDRMNIFNCLFIPKGLDQETLEKYQKKAYTSFYLRPGTIIKKIIQLGKNKYAPRILFYGGISLLYLMFSKKKN